MMSKRLSSLRPRPIVPVALTLLAILILPSPAFAGADATFDTSKGLLWMYLVSFGAGFVTSLTPCVYPMIPIVVGIFGARDEHVSRRKAFMLAASYVLGMGVMFSSLGVIFALAGGQSNAVLANPWFVIPLVIFYVALAASMFGAFEIALPMSVQNRLNQVGGKGYGGAFGMGLVGGLTAAPCTGPFLAGILAFVAASASNAFVGGSLLFVFALGMGVLFLAVGAFALRVPKSGAWMESVKSFGGIALLGVAMYFLRPIWPALRKAADAGVLFLLGAIAVALVGIFAGGAIHLSFHGSPLTRLRKGAGILLTVIGISGIVNWKLTPPNKLPWTFDEDAAFAAAREQGKGVMIDFAAEWCIPCKQLERDTFSAFEVREKVLDSFVPLRFDVTKDTDLDEAHKAKYEAANLPAVIFVDAHGKELGRINSFTEPDDFLAKLNQFQ